MSSPLESLPQTLITTMLRLPKEVFCLTLYPSNIITNNKSGGMGLLPPLAYLLLSLLTATYWASVWLFILSAFGVVWVDAQLAWRAEELGLRMTAEWIRDGIEEVVRTKTALPEVPELRKPQELSNPANGPPAPSEHLTSAEKSSIYPPAPPPAPTPPRSPSPSPSPPHQHSRFPQLQTVFEEEADLMSDLTQIQQELTTLLSRRSTATPPPVDRPKAPHVQLLDIPPLPPSQDDLDLVSMEELHLLRNPSSIPKPATPDPLKELVQHLPIIDDVLSEYEASLDRPETPDTPATSVGGDDDEEHAPSPSSFPDQAEPLELKPSLQQEEVEMLRKDVVVVTRSEVRSTRSEVRSTLPRRGATFSRKPQHKKKKNNGWKTIPRKHRLSGGAKERFVSRRFW